MGKKPDPQFYMDIMKLTDTGKRNTPSHAKFQDKYSPKQFSASTRMIGQRKSSWRKVQNLIWLSISEGDHGWWKLLWKCSVSCRGSSLFSLPCFAAHFLLWVLLSKISGEGVLLITNRRRPHPERIKSPEKVELLISSLGLFWEWWKKLVGLWEKS